MELFVIVTVKERLTTYIDQGPNFAGHLFRKLSVIDYFCATVTDLSIWKETVPPTKLKIFSIWPFVERESAYILLKELLGTIAVLGN